jgi:hypothetical protein
MFMPGISIAWPNAGAETAAQSSATKTFTRTPLKGRHPRRPAGGAPGSTAAVLAGAGIAAASRFGAAAALAVHGIGLAIGHFTVLFSLLKSERIAI